MARCLRESDFVPGRKPRALSALYRPFSPERASSPSPCCWGKRSRPRDWAGRGVWVRAFEPLSRCAVARFGKCSAAFYLSSWASPLWFYSTFHMARRPAMVCTNTHTALYFSRAVMNAQRYTLALARARIHRITVIMDDSAALRLHLLPDVWCQRRKKSALYATTWKPEVWREAYCGCLHYSSGKTFF